MRERDTKRESERHLETRTTTYFSDSDHIVQLIKVTSFLAGRCPADQNASIRVLCIETETENEVLTQNLIGMPSTSIPKCDSELSLASLQLQMRSARCCQKCKGASAVYFLCVWFVFHWFGLQFICKQCYCRRTDGSPSLDPRIQQFARVL